MPGSPGMASALHRVAMGRTGRGGMSSMSMTLRLVQHTVTPLTGPYPSRRLPAASPHSPQPTGLQNVPQARGLGGGRHRGDARQRTAGRRGRGDAGG